MKIAFKNRYKDIYTFTKTEEGILWEGDFKWVRSSWPNNYDKAYEAYCNDEETKTSRIIDRLTLDEFKDKVHSYDPNTFESGKIAKKYASLVYSDKTKIDMVDPSGGPYLHSKMDLGCISSEFKGMVIDSFVPNKEGYLIKTK
jgi:hypothetical protein